MPMITTLLGRMPAARLAVAGAAVLAICAACWTPGGESDSAASAEAYGYRWIGSGEPGNFATAHGFCRQTVQQENFGNLSSGWEQRGSGMVSFNMPDVAIAGPSYRGGGYAARRDYDSCMRSQGWVQVSTMQAQPMPMPSPSASSPPPAPSKPE